MLCRCRRPIPSRHDDRACYLDDYQAGWLPTNLFRLSATSWSTHLSQGRSGHLPPTGRPSPRAGKGRECGRCQDEDPDGTPVLVLPDAESSRCAQPRGGRVALCGGRAASPSPFRRLHPGRVRAISRTAFSRHDPWGETHVFFSDERCVAPDDPAAMRGWRVALLDHVPVDRPSAR
jgi:hypothetical protein